MQPALLLRSSGLTSPLVQGVSVLSETSHKHLLGNPSKILSTMSSFVGMFSPFEKTLLGCYCALFLGHELTMQTQLPRNAVLSDSQSSIIEPVQQHFTVK